MKRSILLCGLALTVAPLAACDEGYGYGGGISYASSYPYDGYYDNYYGPIYDGYWGSNNRFYYRSHEGDRYRPGHRDHFRREGNVSGGNWQRLQGNMQPRPGTRMPHFNGGGNGNRDGGRHH